MIRLLLVAAIAYSVYWFLQPEGCGTEGALACPDPALEEGVGTTLDVARVCTRRAGYLCEERKTFQVARWALDKGKIRVRVPPVSFMEGDEAQRVQQAAIEGIMEWNNHPLPIEVSVTNFPFPRWDIRVVWTKGLPSQIGHARIEGKEDGKRYLFSVDGIAVVVPPIGGSQTLEIGSDMNPAEFFAQAEKAFHGQPIEAVLVQVKAIAMHEMGHALGLMHSDSEKDIMFPQFRPNQTEARASKRDLETVNALYKLPNGARVQ